MIIFHAIDTVGLGHLSRTLGIAQAIRNISSIPILFLTEATDARLLEEYPFGFFQIPNKDSFSQNVRWKHYDKNQILASWEGIFCSIIKAFDPKLLIHDTYIWDEFYQNARDNNIMQILIMRKQNNLEEHFHKHLDMMQSMKLIIFPHDNTEIPEINIPSLKEKFFFSGKVVRRSWSDLDLTVTRDDFGLSDKRFLITVSNGGGNALESKSDNFFEVVNEAIQSLNSELPPYDLVFIKGPLAKKNIPHYPQTNGTLIIREYEPKILELYRLSDLVITRGGYNTVNELAIANVPSVCIPAPRILDNQASRIIEASKSSPLIRYSILDSISIHQEIKYLLAQPRYSSDPQSIFDQYSSNKKAIAEKILNLLNF